MAAGYVTNYGNIENDGLSWSTPKRSIQSAIDAGLYPIYIKGHFHETVNIYKQIIGDGYAVWDGTLLQCPVVTPSSTGYMIEGVTIQNFYKLTDGYYNDYLNIILKNIEIAKTTIGLSRANGWTRCLIINVSYFDPDLLKEHNTLYNTGLKLIQNDDSGYYQHNVVSECSVEVHSNLVIKYSLFHNCTFKFTGGNLGTNEADFIAPIGANDFEKIDNLRQRMATVYGGVASQYLQGCRYQTDGDLFINPAKENFYLVPGCLATKMSYEAQFVGKYPEASLADFASNFASYTNIDASGNIIDQTVDASAETNIQDLGKLRHINSLEALGERASRNGNQVNVDADLGANILPGTNLVDSKTYLVRKEAISQTASGKTRDVGETFIATAADGLGFTSDTGYVQEVYLNKPRTIELKASKTDAILAVTPWVKMDLYKEPRVNYDDNGQIQYGNADAGYDEATSERLFIRYWKVKVTIKAKNLPA